MNRFQPMKFENLDDFFDYLPSDQLAITELLREIILNCIPGVQEKLSYNVPYYSKNRRICFIWPSAVPWGKVKQEGVLLGFCYGNLLIDEEEYLEKGKRKQVYTKTFFSPAEVNEEKIRYFIYEALAVDASFSR